MLSEGWGGEEKKTTEDWGTRRLGLRRVVWGLAGFFVWFRREDNDEAPTWCGDDDDEGRAKGTMDERNRTESRRVKDGWNEVDPT